MGWKISLIIIENPDNFKDEPAILKAIGKEDFELKAKRTFEECIYPNDGSINIGNYSGNIIISDNYKITTKSLDRAKNLNLTIEEEGLCELFPTSEIITIACHSVVNYHGYSLIEKGKKTRLKTISTDTPLMEFGERTIEEEKIYSNSYLKEGINYWKGETNPDWEFTEDELLEEFVFGIAFRRLGIMIDQFEADEIMQKI